MDPIEWAAITDLIAQNFVCGYCGKDISSQRGYRGVRPGYGTQQHAGLFICHHCKRPTFIDLDGSQTPGMLAGETVNDISEKSVADLYLEARKSVGAGAPTAGILACRKLLMHIAVAKGARAGESFLTYVEFFADKNFIPPDAKGWVDHIRKKANEANHEIVIMTREDAIDLLSFSAMLLKILYEFPATVKKRTSDFTERKAGG